MSIFNKNALAVAAKRNEVQTIPVRDLKEYLVKDFEQIKMNEVEIERLKDEISRLEVIEIKYKATLITLEEFDARVEREKEKARSLEVKLESSKREIKQLNEKVNNCVIREKQALDKINNVKATIENEYKQELINKISNIKGSLSKKLVCDLIQK